MATRVFGPVRPGDLDDGRHALAGGVLTHRDGELSVRDVNMNNVRPIEASTVPPGEQSAATATDGARRRAVSAGKPRKTSPRSIV